MKKFRYGSAILALLCVGAALAYAVLQETPRGKLAGKITRRDTGAAVPFARVVAYGNGETFYARADAKGNYSFSGLPVGKYEVTSYSRSEAFTTSGAKTAVDEGQSSELPLVLGRARPDLQQTQQQSVFLPGEPVSLPVHGYVDPAKKQGDALRVKLWKTRLSDVMKNPATAQALAQVSSRWERPATLPTALLKPVGTAAPRLISEKILPIKEADAEGFYHKRVPLDVQGLGLYLIEVAHQEGKDWKTVCGWVNVTGTALVLKRASGQMLAFVADLQSGKPRANFPVQTFYDGEIMASATTDEGGLATLKLPNFSSSNLLTVAQRGDDEAALSVYANDDGNIHDVVSHVYTDRPIYRPGQKISFKGISRMRSAEFGMRNLHSAFHTPRSALANVEVRDPSGVRILKTQKTINNYGSFAGDFELSPEAPTGNYSLITTINGRENSTDILVASYRKPEFEVTVTPGKERYFKSDTMSMEISAKYYFGTPVAGAKVSFEIYRESDWRDEEYAEEYEGEGYGGYGEFIRDGQGVLDENGKLIVNFSARSAAEIEAAMDEKSQDEDDGRTQIFTAHVTVTDAAERSVESEGKARLVAGDFMLSVQPRGYVAQPNEPLPLDIVARDHDGKPIANLPINLELGYWRRDKTSRDDPQAEYQEGGEPVKSTFVALRSQSFTTNTNGVATGSVTPPRNGEMLLTARAKDRAGRAIRGTANFWAAGASGDYSYYGDYASDLSLFADKKHYAAGETARVLINSAQTGQSVLLTLEGEKIFRSWLVPIRERSTIFQVPLEDSYGPNIFLAACFVRDKKFAQSSIPLSVRALSREVNVQISADKNDYAPGAKVSYAVQTTDAKGRPIPAEFSFGVVDESIYALREDDPESLAKAFYPRRENRVQTSHSFATEYLGDANKAAPKIEPRRKFLDTAFWQPFAQTGADGRAKISFNLPDNLTKWRATAIAQTQDTAFGFGVRKVTASKDFFVRLEKPRFLNQRDKSQLTAFIHNETGSAQKASVKLSLSGLQTSKETTQQIELAPGQVGEMMWPVEASDFGDAKITLAAWTQNNRFTDALQEALPIRPHGREFVAAYAGQVTKSATETVNFDANAIPRASRLTVRLTPSVVSSLTGGLEYLTGYPYGCVEQTMSRFLPDILVHRVLKTGLPTDEKSLALQRELPKMVRDGLTRLYAMQHDLGAWGWWEYDEDQAWMTAYVLYGLAEARRAGFVVDENRFSRGRKAAIEMLPAAKEQHRAFLIYALALGAQTPQEQKAIAKERGKTNWRGWDGEALAYLLLADKWLGFNDPKLRPAFERRAVSADGMTHWKHWTGAQNAAWNSDSSDNTATAAALRAVLATNPKDEHVPGILRWLMARRTGEYWESTRDTSQVLAALCDYLEARPGAADWRGNISIKLNGAPLKTFALTPQLAAEPDLQISLSGDKLRAGKNSVSLERSGGSSPVFYSVQLRQTIGTENVPPLPGKLKIEREYLRIGAPERNNRWQNKVEATNGKLAQSDQIRVKLTFTAPRDMAYVLIEDAFPSGCETTQRGTASEEVSGENWRYGYASLDVSNVDVRDDRIAFFARKVPAGTHTISYHLRAQTPGVYHVMPATLAPMYDPEIRAESAESRVEVR
jgi:alpha-2-macroglobulin